MAKFYELKGSLTIFTIVAVLGLIGVLNNGSAEYIGLVAGRTLTARPQLWAFLTAGLFENSIFMLLGNLLLIVVVCPFLEIAWGANKIIQYILFVNAVTYACVFLILVFTYMSVLDTKLLFNPIFGFSPITAALTVGVFQKLAHRPLIASIPAFSTRYLPGVMILTHILLVLLNLIPGYHIGLVCAGTIFGWTYLRFMMVDTETRMKGDSRETFEFAKLFPDLPVLQPCLIALSNITYTAFKSMGCCQLGSNDKGVAAAKTDAVVVRHDHGVPIIKSSDPNKERRRAMAMKAIDDKLAQLNVGGEDDNVELNIDLGDDDLMVGLGNTADLDAMVAEAEAQAGLEQLEKELP